MTFSNYAAAEAFLNGFINYEKLLGGPVAYGTKTFDLSNFRDVLRTLGDPHLQYTVIHVAGTKGKGSTCALLHEVLRASGLRTGLYTSPHIDNYMERIVVDGRQIPEDRFCSILDRLRERYSRPEVSDAGSNFRTVFELLTAAAFLYFADQRVDVAVIETGLGGRLDSTNVFDAPSAVPGACLINAITAVGIEHTAVLGDTVEKIAAEKAGILRPHALTVLGPQPEGWADKVAAIVDAKAREVGQRPVFHAEELVGGTAVSASADGATPPSDGMMAATYRLHLEAADKWFRAAGFPGDIADASPVAAQLARGWNIASRLAGRHQVDNMRTALGVLVALQATWASHESRPPAAGQAPTPHDVEAGAANTVWPGRFEIVCTHPLVVIDGAHCALSAGALGDTFAGMFGSRPVIAVMGFMRDKAIADICRMASRGMKIVGAVLCTPPSPRGLDAQEAARIVSGVLEVTAAAIPDPAHAVRFALDQCGEEEAVVVFGSMFLIGPAGRAVAEMQQQKRQTT